MVNEKYERRELYNLTSLQLDHLSAIFEKLHIIGVIEQGQADAIFTSLEKSREAAIGVVMGMPIMKGQTPILPVISQNFLDIPTQMQMVKHNGKIGKCGEIDTQRIQNFGRNFAECYWVVGVKSGEEFLGVAPSVAEVSLKRINRKGLTVAEVIALSVHTNVLQHYFMDALYSSYQGMVVSLCLYADGPTLECADKDDTADKWGTPSRFYRV